MQNLQIRRLFIFFLVNLHDTWFCFIPIYFSLQNDVLDGKTTNSNHVKIMMEMSDTQQIIENEYVE